MTIQGALTEIFIMLNDETMPIYFKPSLKKVAETIEAEQRVGHWKEYNKPYDIDGTYYCYCDNCGGDAHEKTDFCPSCGAKMVEP